MSADYTPMSTSDQRDRREMFERQMKAAADSRGIGAGANKAPGDPSSILAMSPPPGVLTAELHKMVTHVRERLDAVYARLSEISRRVIGERAIDQGPIGYAGGPETTAAQPVIHEIESQLRRCHARLNEIEGEVAHLEQL